MTDVAALKDLFYQTYELATLLKDETSFVPLIIIPDVEKNLNSKLTTYSRILFDQMQTIEAEVRALQTADPSKQKTLMQK